METLRKEGDPKVALFLHTFLSARYFTGTG